MAITYPIRMLTFEACTVVIRYDEDYVETRFPNCEPIIARPHDTKEYKRRARALGYETAGEMNREHDPLHSYLAEKQGLPCSPVLKAVAEGRDIDRQVADREEAMVLAFQRYMNTGAEHSAIEALRPLGLIRLRDEAVKLLR